MSAHAVYSAAQRAYDALRDEILGGTFAPAQPLGEEELSARYGVSRTPVREAIRQLGFDGLVTIVPRRGVFVREISMRDILEIFQIREAIEGYALDTCAGAVEREQLLALEKDVSELQHAPAPSEEAVSTVDIRFHDMLLVELGNQRMIEFLDRQRLQIMRFRAISLKSADRRKRVLDELLSIINHLIASENDEARRCLIAHLQTGRDIILDVLAGFPSASTNQIVTGGWKEDTP